MAGCTYTFDLEDWVAGADRGAKRLPDRWRCPHEGVDGRDYCPFHADDASSERIRTAFRDALADGTHETNSFIGATLPDLGIAGEEIDTSTGIDLRAVTFTETVDFEDTRFYVPLDFAGSHFEKRLEIDDTVFEREVTFYGCRFDGVVEGNGTTFVEDAYVARASFHFSLILTASTTFEGDAFFTSSTFDSAAEFSNTAFEGQAFFRDVAFEGRTSFDRSTFRDSTRFADAEFSGSFSANHARFDGVLQFGREGINRNYDAARFVCPLVLEHVSCHDGAYFVGCEFESGASFVKSTFDSVLDLSEIILGEELNLSSSTFANLKLSPEATDGSLLVRGQDTNIQRGKVGQPTDGELFCHFEQATVGSVEFLGESSDGETRSRSGLERVRFVDTTFDGFDFTSYRPALESDWVIHRFEAANSFDSVALTPVDQELTYMRAKTGATTIGDNRSAGGFFIREMRARGMRHRNSMREGSIRSGLRYLGNWSFRLSSNYAESPVHVLGFSVLLILLFGVFYSVSFPAAGLSQPYSNFGVLGYLLLSGESFVALVHSPTPTIPDLGLRLLTVLEGAIGAFIIALFLFTLTRAVHR